MDLDDVDLNLNIVRQALNNDKIKLWLPPYEKDSTELEKLSELYSKKLNIESPEVLRCLNQLKEKALENLKEKDAYQSTGLANLKIKPPSKVTEPFNVKIKLSSKGEELKQLIGLKCSIPLPKIKLISKGQVIGDEESLEKQGVKHGAQIMVLLLTSSPEEMAEFEKNQSLLDSTKKDVNLLNGKFNKNGDSYLQIADQTGKPITLPRHEEKALVLAMALHEKGRAAMKSSLHQLALLLLLEAEKEFSRCNSKLLEMVDNYGLLSLDLAWCYLNLQSLSQLPDAQVRLQKCETNFHKSYGVNLERLIAVKGSTENVKTLFLRLHLLQAIVLYHQGKSKEAAVLLNKVDSELKPLKVDPEKLKALTDSGYYVQESRLALRETNGDVEAATAVIEQKRAERRKNLELERKERALNKEREKLGRCLDGNWVEPQFHKSLLGMGFSHWPARWALSQTNNRISDAIAIIQEQFDRIPPPPLDNDTINKICELGFDRRMVAAALKKTRGNLVAAVEELTANGGVIAGVIPPDLDPNQAGPSSEAKRVKRKERDEKEMEAFQRVAEGLTEETEDYLDSSLAAEEEFLNKYKNLISHF